MEWFPAVRDTEPMGAYGAVFDYKWLGWKDGDLRAHAFAMLFWDGLLVGILFHNRAAVTDVARDRSQISSPDCRHTRKLVP
jgi:hypothetical protein